MLICDTRLSHRYALAMFTLPYASEINRHRPCSVQSASCARKLNAAPDIWKK